MWPNSKHSHKMFLMCQLDYYSGQGVRWGTGREGKGVRSFSFGQQFLISPEENPVSPCSLINTLGLPM